MESYGRYISTSTEHETEIWPTTVFEYDGSNKSKTSKSLIGSCNDMLVLKNPRNVFP